MSSTAIHCPRPSACAVKLAALLALSPFIFSNCTNDGAAVTRECEQGVGEACNKLGKDSSGAEAERFFRKACDLGNTNGCVNLAGLVRERDPGAAKQALHYACDRGNTNACAKLAELLQSGSR